MKETFTTADTEHAQRKLFKPLCSLCVLCVSVVNLNVTFAQG
jgi:hypothetical protein